jgi:DNA end-binding protein Ku
MKALWKGYIVLGRLGIPVRLYAATQEAGLKFVQLHDKDSSPVERPLFCKAEHKEIPYSEVIRGVETEPGKYVTFTAQELERSHESADTIGISQFVATDQISAIFYEKPYYIVPVRSGEHGYALFREGLTRTSTTALGRFYFYGNEYVGAIAPYEDLLLLHRLRYVDELVPRSHITSPALPRANPSEIDMLQAIIERNGGPLHMRDYHDEHTEHLKLLRERKAKGLPMPKPERLPVGITSETNIRSALTQMMGQSTDLAAATSSATRE